MLQGGVRFIRMKEQQPIRVMSPLNISGFTMFVSGALGVLWNGYAFERHYPQVAGTVMPQYADMTQPVADWSAPEWANVWIGVSAVGLALIIPLIISALRSTDSCTGSHNHHDH